jgi:hypothetical protein
MVGNAGEDDTSVMAPEELTDQTTCFKLPVNSMTFCDDVASIEYIPPE